MSHQHQEPKQIENHQLSQIIAQNERIIRLLQIIAKEDAPPILAKIKVAFSKGTPMSLVAGPVTLTTAGQQATAGVLGFNQFGQPYSGTMPAATLSSDDSAQAFLQFDPATGQMAAVANGVANITGTVQTVDANGNPVTLTDTEAVTVAIPITPPPPEILASIKVGFDTGGAAGLASAFRKK